MLIGETVCWRGEAVFPVKARTRRHIHTLRRTQVGADEGISAYTEVMELSFLASLPESSSGVVVHWTGNCSISTQTEVGDVWVYVQSVPV